MSHTCAICFEVFVSPRALPCIHTYCEACLDGYLQANSVTDEETFSCPICKASHTLPKGGIKEFPTNPYVHEPVRRTSSSGPINLKLSRVHEPLRRVSSSGARLCFHEPVIRTSSSGSRQLTIHEPVSRTSSSGSRQSGSTPGSSTPLPTTDDIPWDSSGEELVITELCSAHNRELCFYCVSCQTVACNKCFLTQHKTHQVIDLEERASKDKERLQELVRNTSRMTEGLMEHKEMLNIACESLEYSTSRNIHQIEKHTEEIIIKLKVSSEGLKKKAQDHKTEQLEEIRAMIGQLETNALQLTEIQDEAYSLLNCETITTIAMNTPELLSDGNKLFQMKLANLQKTNLEFKPTAHLVEDLDKAMNMIGTLGHSSKVIELPQSLKTFQQEFSTSSNPNGAAFSGDLLEGSGQELNNNSRTGKIVENMPNLQAEHLASKEMNCDKVHAMCSTSSGEIAVLCVICGKVLVRTYQLSTSAESRETEKVLRKTWECVLGDTQPCDIIETTLHGTQHFAISYPSNHSITIIGRDKKITTAYKKKTYKLGLMRKTPTFVEDIFALDQQKKGDKNILRVLDCCKLPWNRVRDISLAVNEIDDFCIVESNQSCNVIITTNTLASSVQGLNFIDGSQLWEIKGINCGLLGPLKITLESPDEVYITDTKSEQVHVINSSGYYRQSILSKENGEILSPGCITKYRQELYLTQGTQSNLAITVFKIKDHVAP